MRRANKFLFVFAVVLLLCKGAQATDCSDAAALTTPVQIFLNSAAEQPSPSPDCWDLFTGLDGQYFLVRSSDSQDIFVEVKHLGNDSIAEGIRLVLWNETSCTDLDSCSAIGYGKIAIPRTSDSDFFRVLAARGPGLPGDIQYNVSREIGSEDGGTCSTGHELINGDAASRWKVGAIEFAPFFDEYLFLRDRIGFWVSLNDMLGGPVDSWITVMHENSLVRLDDVAIAVIETDSTDCAPSALVNKTKWLDESGGTIFCDGNANFVLALITVPRSLGYPNLWVSAGQVGDDDGHLCYSAFNVTKNSTKMMNDMCKNESNSLVGVVDAFDGIFPLEFGICGFWFRVYTTEAFFLSVSYNSSFGTARIDGFTSSVCDASLGGDCRAINIGKLRAGSGTKSLSILWEGWSRPQEVLFLLTADPRAGTVPVEAGWDFEINVASSDAIGAWTGLSPLKAIDLSLGDWVNCAHLSLGWEFGSSSSFYEIPWHNISLSTCASQLDPDYKHFSKWGEAGMWFEFEVFGPCLEGPIEVKTLGDSDSLLVGTRVAVFQQLEGEGTKFECLGVNQGSGAFGKRSVVTVSGLFPSFSKLYVLVMSTGVLSSGENNSFAFEVSGVVKTGTSILIPIVAPAPISNTTYVSGIWDFGKDDVYEKPLIEDSRDVGVFENVSATGIWILLPFSSQFPHLGAVFFDIYGGSFFPAFVLCFRNASSDARGCSRTILAQPEFFNASRSTLNVTEYEDEISGFDSVLVLIAIFGDPDMHIPQSAGAFNFTMGRVIPPPVLQQCVTTPADISVTIESMSLVSKLFNVSSNSYFTLFPGAPSTVDLSNCESIQDHSGQKGEWFVLAVKTASSVPEPFYVGVNVTTKSGDAVPVFAALFDVKNCSGCLQVQASAMVQNSFVSLWHEVPPSRDPPDTFAFNYPLLVNPVTGPVEDWVVTIIIEKGWPKGSAMSSCLNMNAVFELGMIPLGQSTPFEISLTSSTTAKFPPGWPSPFVNVFGYWQRIGGQGLPYDFLPTQTSLNLDIRKSDSTWGDARLADPWVQDEEEDSGCPVPRQYGTIMFVFLESEVVALGAQIFVVAQNSTTPTLLAGFNSSDAADGVVVVSFSFDACNQQVDNDTFLFVTTLYQGVLHGTAVVSLDGSPPAEKSAGVQAEELAMLYPAIAIPGAVVVIVAVPFLATPGVETALMTILGGVQCSALLVQVGTILPEFLVKIGGFLSIASLGFSMPFDVGFPSTEDDTTAALAVDRFQRSLHSMSQYAQRKGMSESEIFPAQLWWSLVVIAVIHGLVFVCIAPFVGAGHLAAEALVRHGDPKFKKVRTVTSVLVVRCIRVAFVPLSLTLLPLSVTACWYAAHTSYTRGFLPTSLYVIAFPVVFLFGICVVIPFLHIFGVAMMLPLPSMVQAALCGDRFHRSRRWWVAVSPLRKLLVGAVVGFLFDVPALQIVLLLFIFGLSVVGVLVWHPYLSGWNALFDVWTQGLLFVQLLWLCAFIGNTETVDVSTTLMVFSWLIFVTFVISAVGAVTILCLQMSFALLELATKKSGQVAKAGVERLEPALAPADELDLKGLSDIPTSSLSGNALLRGIASLGLVFSSKLKSPRPVPLEDEESEMSVEMSELRAESAPDKSTGMIVEVTDAQVVE